jgi:hypothetical protein
MIMTCEQEKKYLENKGLRCPYCYSTHIGATKPLAGYDLVVMQEIECSTCGQVWNDVYTLTGATT